MASETPHEDPDKLGPETIDQHRAIVSLMEELEAVDWYNQRVQLYLEESFTFRVLSPQAAVPFLYGAPAR